MRIFYDGYVFGAQRSGGISRYFTSLISKLPADIEPVVTGVLRLGGEPLRHPRLRYHRGIALRPKRFFLGLQKPYFDWIRIRGAFDVAHPTYHYQLSGRSISSYAKPAVFTVHDMIPELFPDLLGPAKAEIDARRAAIEAASAIICVSENTRADLLEFYPQAEQKTCVIYHAAELPVPETKRRSSSGRPYFLYVGARHAYKGFDTLLRAFAKIRTVAPDVRLQMTGPPLQGREKQRIADLGLEGRVEHAGYASDRELAHLYRESLALVYPSLYEGFGLPVLEAMACGTAVIASNSSSIPEIAGECGLLCAPGSVEEFADAMLSIFRDSSLRRRYIETGLRRATDFSWKQTVSRTVDVYRSVM
jgi:glycosyltransferase involved in cell wall biosynthesis